MKKSISVFLLCLILLLQFSLTACERAVPPEQDFSFSIIDPQIEVSVGEPVTFHAELTNQAKRDYKLTHGNLNPIYIQISPEINGAPPLFYYDVVCKSNFAPQDTISNEYTAQFDEPGTYTVKALCKFSVNNTELQYQDSITVVVTQ